MDEGIMRNSFAPSVVVGWEGKVVLDSVHVVETSVIREKQAIIKVREGLHIITPRAPPTNEHNPAAKILQFPPKHNV